MHRLLMHRLLLVVLLSSPVMAAAAEPAHRGPVIDMHLHAYAMENLPPGIPACTGDQGVPVPTVDPRAELDFASLGACERPMFGA